MRCLSIVLLGAIVLWLSPSPVEAAAIPRQIKWEELAPQPTESIEDPLEHLDPFIKVELFNIASALRQTKSGLMSPVSQEYEAAMEARYRLEQLGVEVQVILRRLEAVETEIRRLGEQVINSLDGQFVKIPGYALPVEFDGDAVQEFFLVPYVGACIHVPPPPQNQMILVEPAEPFLVGSLFEPVWIVGRISVKDTRRTLPVSDGEIPVRAGYRIEGANVEAYRE
ncbi:MAG: DUF3299 domain-containing protein [Pseudomonadota bacterium]|nr:DUF3299 domain-containing protein [Pseudomonadota bacterium]